MYVMLPSKTGGHIALLLSVCVLVGRSVSVHLLRRGCTMTYWNEFWFTVFTCRSSSVLDTMEQCLTELWHLGLRKIPICNYYLFSSQRLHILKWNLVYRLIIRKSRSSLVLGTIDQFLRSFDLQRFHFLFCYFCSSLLHRLNKLIRYIVKNDLCNL